MEYYIKKCHSQLSRTFSSSIMYMVKENGNSLASDKSFYSPAPCSYAQRFEDIERRESSLARREAQHLENVRILESDMAAREAKLATFEVSLLRRAEALALIEQEISARISRTAHDAYNSPPRTEQARHQISPSLSPSRWRRGSRLQRWESGACAEIEVPEAGGGSPWRREEDGDAGGECARGGGGGGGKYVPMGETKEIASPR